jgi:hypothetical protein
MFKALVCALLAALVAVVSANEFHSPNVVTLKSDFNEKVRCAPVLARCQLG